MIFRYRVTRTVRYEGEVEITVTEEQMNTLLHSQLEAMAAAEARDQGLGVVSDDVRADLMERKREGE